NCSLVNELSDLFDISNDSAYRRLRGETALTFDEIIILCKKYNISFDFITGLVSNSVTFKYEPNGNTKEEFKNYLSVICNDLEMLSKTKNCKIIYAAEDIPLFHHFQYPELASFKLFYWMKSVMNVPEYIESKFSPDIIDNEILDLCKKMDDYYRIIPSVEIWTELTINSLIKQIQFYWDSGLFADKKYALSVCDCLKLELENIMKQAEKSTKFINDREMLINEGNFTLYHSEVEIGNNCILASVSDNRTVYLSHFTFNFISTTGKSFCDETEKWLNNLIRKSILISGVSEKQRYQFFSAAVKSVENLKKRIENE
ncbi:MAG: hypothetical protein ABIJ97_09075, partial [Bacteroidota bacterium]